MASKLDHWKIISQYRYRSQSGDVFLISFGCIQVDPSQMQALAAIWSVLLTAGVALAVGLPACTLSNACEAVMNAQVESHHVRVLSDSNRVLAMVTGFLIGAPVAKAAGTYLQTSGRVWFMHSNMFSIVAHLVYFELWSLTILTLFVLLVGLGSETITRFVEGRLGSTQGFLS